MPKFQTLIMIKITRGILVTVAVCDQCRATRIVAQARRSSAHGNTRYQKLAKLKVISRNGGSFLYAISDKSLIAYHKANPSKKERVTSTRTQKVIKFNGYRTESISSGVPQKPIEYRKGFEQ